MLICMWQHLSLVPPMTSISLIKIGKRVLDADSTIHKEEQSPEVGVIAQRLGMLILWWTLFQTPLTFKAI